MQYNRNRRSLHMNHLEEYKYARTAEGSKPLTTPASIRKSSLDPNRSLYPKANKRKQRNLDEIEPSTSSTSASDLRRTPSEELPGFQLASSLDNNRRTTKGYDNKEIEQGVRRERTRRIGLNSRRQDIKLQTNTLLNYFPQMKRSSTGSVKATTSPETHEIEEMESECEKMDSSGFDSEDDEIFNFNEKKYYNGLLGLNSVPFSTNSSSEVSIMENLPPDILENILCHLPCYDLCFNASRVCRQWNDLISYPLFMPWKKKYGRIKNGDERTICEINEILTENNFDNASDCLFGLVRFMVRNYVSLSRFDVLDRLRHHPKYSWVVDLVTERLQDCVKDGVPSAACIITVLCIVADTVKDISLLLSMLIQSYCPAKHSIDCLYCILTFLFVFKSKGYIGIGFHYRLYHALFLYENECNVCVADLTLLTRNTIGQQNIMKYTDENTKLRLSGEQLRIVNHDMRPRETLKIIAFAGTGKTTMLIQFARMRPNLKFLHVAFNKSVSEHAKKLFPSNVICRTIHSLAYRAIGLRYRHKLCFKLRPLDVMQCIQFPHNKMMGSAYALRTLENFMNSVDDEVNINHVPNPLSNSVEVNRKFDSNARSMVAEDARRIWERMIDPNDTNMKIVHDTYLKLYQLSRPKLGDVDCILVDEAQDCNAAILKIIQNQECCKILVGDPHQQIYGFRGAIDSLNFIDATHTYYLTQSFRFGPKIAYVATCVLDSLKKVRNKSLVGLDLDGGYDGQVEGQEAVIARSNHVLFNEVVNMCTVNQSIQASFAGELRSYNFDQMLDIYNLMKGESCHINDKFIKCFKSLGHLKTYADIVEDQDLLGKIKIVLHYNAKIPEYINLIKSRCSFSMDSASVVFSTAHKAKGLEFDTVRLMEDFLPGGFIYRNDTDALEWKQNTGTKYPDDEANILYVAVTRAKKRLVMSTAVALTLVTANETFELIMSSSKLKPSNEEQICVVCRQWNHVPVSTLSLMRETIQFKNDQMRIFGGPLCCVCAEKPAYLLRNLVSCTSLSAELLNRTHVALNDFVGPLPKIQTVRINPNLLWGNDFVVPVFID